MAEKSGDEILRELREQHARKAVEREAAGREVGEMVAPLIRAVSGHLWKWSALLGGGCLFLVIVHALAIAAVVVALLGMECG